MIHALKTEPEYFEAVLDGSKTFEVRKNDRGFRVGDYLALNEIDDFGKYTRRSILLRITYILNEARFCKSEYVILGFENCTIIHKTRSVICE